MKKVDLMVDEKEILKESFDENLTELDFKRFIKTKKFKHAVSVVIKNKSQDVVIEELINHISSKKAISINRLEKILDMDEGWRGWEVSAKELVSLCLQSSVNSTQLPKSLVNMFTGDDLDGWLKVLADNKCIWRPYYFENKKSFLLCSLGEILLINNISVSNFDKYMECEMKKNAGDRNLDKWVREWFSVTGKHGRVDVLNVINKKFKRGIFDDIPGDDFVKAFPMLTLAIRYGGDGYQNVVSWVVDNWEIRESDRGMLKDRLAESVEGNAKENYRLLESEIESKLLKRELKTPYRTEESTKSL